MSVVPRILLLTLALILGWGQGIASLTTRTNADGIRVRYAYDALGRLTNQWTLTTNGVSSDVAALGYGPSGLLTSRLDASGTHQWVHDILGRLRTNVTPVGTLHYTYDAAGNPLTLASTTASGVNLSYAYDALGRLTNVVDLRLTGANKNTAYGYDLAGNLSWVNYRPISVTNLHTYDPHNRLTSLAWRTTNGATRASFTYTVHTLGMRTGLSETVNGTGRTYTWGYDALHRLKSEALSGWVPSTANYTHDLVGNRKSRSAALGLAEQNLNYDINDWLDNDGVTNTVSSHFDAKGNTVNYAAVTYGYDWDNRLTSSSAGGFSAVYDLEGNRTRKTAGGVTTHYLVATVNPTGWPQVVEEHTGTNPGTVTRRYTYGADLISQSRKNSSSWDTDFFLTDGLGSTRALLNSSGSISDTYTYDAFGNQIASTGTTPNNYRYTGEQWDAELGMYYLRARYMSPAMGRFWSRDTFEGHPTDPLSLHRYLYASANPVNNIDPSGNETLGNVLVTSSIIGGLSGGVVGGIRNGAQGALVGVVSGAVLAPLATLATIGGGIGIASAAGISTTAGITTSFAIVTSGSLAWNTYELLHAKNDRERVAAGVSMLFTVGGAAYGAYRLSEVPTLPSKAPSGNALPASKEQVGALLSETMALRRGEIVVAREVTIETASGVRVRVDLVTKSITGKLRLIDAKFGPGAKFTDNQKVGYPEIGNTGGKIVGGKLEGQGLPGGSKFEPMDVLVDWW